MAKPFQNLLGKRFGKLLVTGGGQLLGRQRTWEVLCDCGKQTTSMSHNLQRGKCQSCGCGKRKDLIGLRFGKGIVIGFIGLSTRGQKSKRSSPVWKLKCDCGKEYQSHAEYLTSNQVSSCGCYKSLFHNIPSVNKSSGTEGACLSAYYKALRYGAVKRGIPFHLSKKRVWELLQKQQGKCALSGLIICFRDKSASIDRIKNDLPYQSDNVHFVHRTINFMKSTIPLDSFLSLCQAIASYTSGNEHTLPLSS